MEEDEGTPFLPLFAHCETDPAFFELLMVELLSDTLVFVAVVFDVSFSLYLMTGHTVDSPPILHAAIVPGTKGTDAGFNVDLTGLTSSHFSLFKIKT